MTKLWFNFYGIGVSFESKDDDMLSLVECNHRYFSTSSGGPSRLAVEFLGYGDVFHRRAVEVKRNDLYQLGPDLYFRDNMFLWKTARFQVLASYENGQIKISGAFSERQDHTFRRLVLGQHSYRYQNCHLIMRYLFQLPVLWLLEHDQDKYILHAAAVEKAGKAIILAGFNHSGKSTLALYMCAHHGYKLLTENYLLFDRESVYPFPEAARLTPSSIELLGLSPQNERLIYGKYHYVPDLTQIAARAKPAALFYIFFGPETYCESISKPVALDRLVSTFHYLHEFPEYTYLGSLDLVVKQREASVEETRQEMLEHLLTRIACYTFSHCQADSLESKIQMILKETDALIDPQFS